MKDILNTLISHHALDKDRARQVLLELASGKYNPSQVSAFMTVYMMRAITIDELEGFRDAMLELCVPFDPDVPVIDVCGTGGDGKNTFNISTLAAFVVAGAGQAVAKHGNYGVSSVSGSSNVLEYFGHTFTGDTKELKRHLEQSGICFMHAPLFHPAMKNVAPIRKELGVKTFFNMLGPMVNPARPPFQFAGVFSLELARQYGYLYQQSQKRFAIVHDLNGYDEISLTGPFKLFTHEGETVLEPGDLGLPVIKPHELAGGESVAASAQIFLTILQGKGTAHQEAVVIANAGMALYCVDTDQGIIKAIDRAKESLESGAALKSFQNLIHQHASVG